MGGERQFKVARGGETDYSQAVRCDVRVEHVENSGVLGVRNVRESHHLIDEATVKVRVERTFNDRNLKTISHVVVIV